MSDIAYLARVSEGDTSFGPPSMNNVDSLIVVAPRDVLPMAKGQLILLHGSHANGSLAMNFDSESSSFECRHCGHKVNISDGAYITILNAISREYTSVDVLLGKTGSVVFYIANFLEEGEDFPKDPPRGYYVKESDL